MPNDLHFIHVDFMTDGFDTELILNEVEFQRLLKIVKTIDAEEDTVMRKTQAWEWIDRANGQLRVFPADKNLSEVHMTLCKEALDYFNTPNCTCSFVPIWELAEVIVTGEADCPVHGL